MSCGNSSRTEVMAKLPNKKLLKFVKKVILGCYKNQHLKPLVVYFLVDRKRTPQKQWKLDMYCGNSSRTEVMAKTAKEKVVTTVIKI